MKKLFILITTIIFLLTATHALALYLDFFQIPSFLSDFKLSKDKIEIFKDIALFHGAILLFFIPITLQTIDKISNKLNDKSIILIFNKEINYQMQIIRTIFYIIFCILFFIFLNDDSSSNIVLICLACTILSLIDNLFFSYKLSTKAVKYQTDLEGIIFSHLDEGNLFFQQLHNKLNTHTNKIKIIEINYGIVFKILQNEIDNKFPNKEKIKKIIEKMFQLFTKEFQALENITNSTEKMKKLRDQSLSNNSIENMEKNPSLSNESALKYTTLEELIEDLFKLRKENNLIKTYVDFYLGQEIAKLVKEAPPILKNYIEEFKYMDIFLEIIYVKLPEILNKGFPADVLDTLYTYLKDRMLQIIDKGQYYYKFKDKSFKFSNNPASLPLDNELIKKSFLSKLFFDLGLYCFKKKIRKEELNIILKNFDVLFLINFFLEDNTQRKKDTEKFFIKLLLHASHEIDKKAKELRSLRGKIKSALENISSFEDYVIELNGNLDKIKEWLTYNRQRVISESIA